MKEALSSNGSNAISITETNRPMDGTIILNQNIRTFHAEFRKDLYNKLY